jgi:hypothetical protein
MPPALDRLLASPAALRLLRALVRGPAAQACLPSVACSHAVDARRSYATTPPKRLWKRWQADVKDNGRRDAVRQLLETDRVLTWAGLGDKQEHAVAEGRAEQFAAVLSRCERSHDHDGILETWNLLRQDQHQLPTDSTPLADYLWGTFIKHPDLVRQAIAHAAALLRETNHTYFRLYTLVMTHWLPRDAEKAWQYHRLMLAELQLKVLPLKELALYGQSGFTSTAYGTLLKIYCESDQRDLYDVVVPSLIKNGLMTMAQSWHDCCLAREDLPSESVLKHPVVHILMAESSMHSGRDAASETSTSSDHIFDEELMRGMQGRDTAPVRFEDSFCARMFATRALTPASIIQGLAMVGVNEIGPQAVLAMATRTQPLEELATRFEELKAAGIALQGCVYSLAIEKFAKDNNWKLVRSMLESDQHPDVFDDAKVQQDLLDYYVHQGDIVQAQRTLAILALFYNDSSPRAWNLLLRAHIRLTGPKHVTEVLQDMRSRDVMVDPKSIMAIKYIIRYRRKGHKAPDLHADFDSLRFVTRVFMSIVEFGLGPIEPTEWQELIRRYGMTGRIKELRRLLLWLLCWYAPRSNLHFPALPIPPFRDAAYKKLQERYHSRHYYFNADGMVSQVEDENHPIRLLFPPSLIQGLIIWGFRAGLLPNADLEQDLLGPTLGKHHYRRRLLDQKTLERKSWSIGLRTVVLLRDLGVHVHEHTVVKALQMQFIVLFGAGFSNKTENRIMEQVNTIPYSRYVSDVNKIWGSHLFDDPESYRLDMPLDTMWHPRLERRPNRRTTIRLDEILGRGWQARDIESREEHTNSTPRDTSFSDVKRSFETQALRPEPGWEWMHESSLNASDVDHYRRLVPPQPEAEENLSAPRDGPQRESDEG